MARIETPVLWRKPPATAIPRAYGNCTEVLLYWNMRKVRWRTVSWTFWMSAVWSLLVWKHTPDAAPENTPSVTQQ